MGNIFRTATTQAILDIIEEHGSKSRFGQLLSEEDAKALASRVVDLFEMTLELRSRTGMISGALQTSAPGAEESPGGNRVQTQHQLQKGASFRVGARRSWNEQETTAPFPTSVNASEFTDITKKRASAPDIASHTDDSGALSFRLPRSRKSFSDEERQAFLKRK